MIDDLQIGLQITNLLETRLLCSCKNSFGRRLGSLSLVGDSRFQLRDGALQTTHVRVIRCVAESERFEGSLRNFGDRPAYDLNGDAQLANPELEYEYLDVEFAARQRITSRMWFGLQYLYSERTDKFVGYNDYIRDQYGANFRWHLGYRFDLALSATYMLYDFPRAFAFDNPTQARKSLERVDFLAEGTFRLTEHLFVVGTVNYVDSQSNDIRVDYDRAQYSIGVRWVQ